MPQSQQCQRPFVHAAHHFIPTRFIPATLATFTETQAAHRRPSPVTARLFPVTLRAMLYGECLALTTAVLWGAIPVLVRKGLLHSTASVAVLVGLLASVPLLFVVVSVHPQPVTQALAPQAAVWFIAVGILGPCLG